MRDSYTKTKRNLCRKQSGVDLVPAQSAGGKTSPYQFAPDEFVHYDSYVCPECGVPLQEYFYPATGVSDFHPGRYIVRHTDDSLYHCSRKGKSYLLPTVRLEEMPGFSPVSETEVKRHTRGK